MSQVSLKSDGITHPTIRNLRVSQTMFMMGARKMSVEKEISSNAQFLAEVAAFDRLKRSLETEYWGKFVSIVGGQVVDADFDETRLVMRVYHKFGYVPMYVRQIGAELPVDEIPSPEEP